MKVTIDGNEVFMDPQDLPAITFAVASDLDLTGIKGSKSTTFKVPATAASRNALGSPAMGEARKGNIELRIGKAGEDYHRSTARVIESDVNEFRLGVVGGNASWIDVFNSTRINELELGETGVMDHTVQEATWDTDSTPAIYPLVDHGYLEARAALFDVGMKFLRPGVRVWHIMDTAFALTGHTLRVTGSLARYWRKLFIYQPKENLELAQTSIDEYTVVKSLPSPDDITTEITNASYAEVETTTLDSGNSGPGYSYSVPYPMKVNVRLDITLTYQFTGASDSRYMVVKIAETTPGSNGLTPGTRIPLKTDTSTHTESFSVDVGAYDLATFTDYHVRLLRPYDLNVNFQLGSIVIESARVTWTPIAAPYDEGLSFTLASTMPALSCMEVLKSIAAHKCLSITTDDRTKTVTVEEYDDFIRPISEGIDTRERQDFKDATRITPRRPKNILFRPKEDSGDELLKEYTDTFNRIYSQHDEANPDGDQKDETVSSSFAPTITGEAMSLEVPIMRDSNGDFQVDEYDRVVRLMIHNGASGGEWVHRGITKTTYPNCYFAKSSEPFSLAMGEETFYGGTGPGTAQTNWANKLRRYFYSDTYQIHLRLYDDELLGFDFGVPRLLWHTDRESSWFLMQKIDQKRFGIDTPTRCQLQQY